MRNMIPRILVLVLMIILLAAVSSQAEAKGPMQFVAEAKAKIVEVTPQQVKADLKADKPIILLDVRDTEEFEAGYLPRAMHISRVGS